jgi:hypothetical protein
VWQGYGVQASVETVVSAGEVERTDAQDVRDTLSSVIEISGSEYRVPAQREIVHADQTPLSLVGRKACASTVAHMADTGIG